MDEQRWKRLQTLFHQAAELPQADQTPFLATACPDDPELIEKLSAMLREDAGSSSLLDGEMADLASQWIGSPDLTGVLPGRFGPYEPLKLLGEGGMGVVYLAERKDVNQRVAIKVLRDAWISPLRRDRFYTERKLLAQLDHPSIAHLYDADALPDGTPWLAMEYVEGIPITGYCELHRCAIPRRLQLFRAVCEAVEYAHSRAIIHRDLKPSNILVREDGSIRLLDFGIAKQIESIATPLRTQTGLRLMTPAYASPEQIRGAPVGVQTDVYSLGVILFELLAGQVPFNLGNLTPGEAAVVLREHDPGKPSQIARHLAAGAASAELAARRSDWADLDVLVLTAMHPDVERRYHSVEALIRDIDHYMRGEPLEARPDTLRYRAWKFAGRNRRSIAAALIVLLLIAGLATYSALRIEHEKDAALAQAARAGRIQNFMMRLFQGGDETAGPSDQLRVVTLLAKGEEEAGALHNDPSVQAELYQTLGSVYESLGQLDRADRLFQAALERDKTVFGPESAEVAEDLVAISGLRVDQARYDEAEKLVREAIAIDRKKLPANHPELARAMEQLGQVLEDRGDYQQAITVLEDVAAIQSQPGGVETDLSSTLTELANSHFYLGHYAASEDLNRRVLEIDRRTFGDGHPNVAQDLINLGAIQMQEGHYAEAAEYDRQALDIFLKFYGKENGETASTMTLLGRALVADGRDSEAEGMLREALAVEEKIYGPVHPRIASTLIELGKISLRQGKLSEAQKDFERSANIYREVYGGKHYYLGGALSNLAEVYVKEKRYDRAEALLRQALQVYGQTLPADHLNAGIAHIRLGNILLQQRRMAEAAQETKAGYDIVRQQTKPPADWMQRAQADLAEEKLPQPAP